MYMSHTERVFVIEENNQYFIRINSVCIVFRLWVLITAYVAILSLTFAQQAQVGVELRWVSDGMIFVEQPSKCNSTGPSMTRSAMDVDSLSLFFMPLDERQGTHQILL